MNLFVLTLSYLRRRPLTALLNVVLLALGVATMVVLLLFSQQMSDNLSRDARGIDLVVGAKGSPLQLILASVYHVDAPTGNIMVRDARAVAAAPAVKSAIPVSQGDSFRGFPLVGTTYAYPAHYGAEVGEGRLWQASGEVVLGADVAVATGLDVGRAIVSTHGLSEAGQAHGGDSLRVVGVLHPTGTVADRLVLTGLETVWDVHSHGATAHEDDHEAAAPPVQVLRAEDDSREITALLVTYSSPMAAALFPRAVNGMDNLVAAAPAFEIARMTNLLGVGVEVVRAFGILLILASLFGVFVTLYSALRERRYDLALLRTLGTSRATLFLHVLLEGFVLAACGLLLGLLVGHGAAEVLGSAIEQEQGFSMTGWAWHPAEAYVALLSLGIGVAAALLPAVQAYRTDLARTLAAG